MARAGEINEIVIGRLVEDAADPAVAVKTTTPNKKQIKGNPNTE